jgi:hypothetical protein
VTSSPSKSHLNLPTTAKENAVSATAAARVTIAWTHIETYRHTFSAGVIAEAADLPVEVLLAVPAMLFGVVNQATAGLLKAAHNDAARPARIEIEIEIIDAQASDQPTLAELYDQARRLIREELDSGRPTDRGLAALIVGLRREGLIS